MKGAWSEAYDQFCAAIQAEMAKEATAAQAEETQAGIEQLKGVVQVVASAGRRYQTEKNEAREKIRMHATAVVTASALNFGMRIKAIAVYVFASLLDVQWLMGFLSFWHRGEASREVDFLADEGSCFQAVQLVNDC
nr:hypothetical protein [Tanacetum cinerariifolium]